MKQRHCLLVVFLLSINFQASFSQTADWIGMARLRCEDVSTRTWEMDTKEGVNLTALTIPLPQLRAGNSVFGLPSDV